MFDTIGRTRKANRQRQAGSMLISVSLFTTALGALMLTGGQRVEEVQVDEVPVEVTFVDVAAPPPPPPPPPPPAASSTPEETKVEEDKPEEIQEPDEIQELPDKLPDPVADAGTVGGVEGGVEGGVVGGTVGGVIGGVIGGELGGQLGGDGVRAVHWSQVKAKRRVEPRFPEAAKALGLKEERCNVRLYIDEEGVPYDINLDACPKVFQDEAKGAALKWRFYPYKDEGIARKTTFMLSFKFVLR